MRTVRGMQSSSMRCPGRRGRFEFEQGIASRSSKRTWPGVERCSFSRFQAWLRSRHSKCSRVSTHLICVRRLGGKTAMIALRQQGRGVLVANDRSRSRLARLRTVLEQHGVSHVELSCNSGESFGGTHASCFDRVLVDAPCSGEGMFRCDDAEAWAEWGLGRIRRLAKQQERLLIAGLRCLRPGGVLVYSTCTHAPEENEAVVHRVLSRIDVDVEVESLPGSVPAGHPGLGTWEGVEFDPQVTLSRRLIPDGWCTGFFLARFRRHNRQRPECMNIRAAGFILAEAA